MPLTEVEILSVVGTSLGSILFGLYTALFPYTIYIVVSNARQRRNEINKVTLGLSAAIYTIALVYLVVSLADLCKGMLSPTTEAATAYFEDFESPLHLAKNLLINLVLLSSDAFMLYRLHIVWLGDRRVVWPVGVLWLFGLAASPLLFLSWTWSIVFVAETLTMNILLMILIATRLKSVQRRAAIFKLDDGGSISMVVEIVIQFGVISIVLLVAALVTIFTRANAAVVLITDVTPSLVGIGHCIMIIRPHLRAIRASHSHSSPPLSISSGHIAFELASEGAFQGQKNMKGQEEFMEE